MDSSSFKYAATAAGMHQIANLANIPGLINQMVETTAKRHAQQLKKTFRDVKLSAALEAVSKGLGFRDWHEFLSLLKQHPPQKPLSKALPLLIRFNDSTTIIPIQDKMLRDYAGGLGTVLRQDTAKILDMIAVSNGRDTYGEVRVDETAVEFNMYLFKQKTKKSDERPATGVVDTPPSFKETNEFTQALVRDVDLNDSREFTRAKKWLIEIINAQPFNAHALRSLAELERYSNRNPYEYYHSALRLVDSFIPSEFDGKILEFEGVGYLRYNLLHGLVLTCMQEDNYEDGIRFAQMAYKQSDKDGMGIRYFLVVLYALTHQHTKAATLIKDIDLAKSDLNGGEKLILSICAYANGDHNNARSLFLHALFLFPPLRYLLTNLGAVRKWDADWNRAVNPDIGMVASILFTANAGIDGIKAFYLTLLSLPTVSEEEARLAYVYKSVSKGSFGFGHWSTVVSQAVEQLSV